MSERTPTEVERNAFELDLSQEITNLIKCHIVNLDDHYHGLTENSKLSVQAHGVIKTAIDDEIFNLAKAVTTMRDSDLITTRQSLACMVKLVELKSNYI